MNYRATLSTAIRQARNTLRQRGLSISRTDPDCPAYGYLELVIFPRFGINCVIDVGASRGEFAGHMRDFGYTGRIVSFEPASGNYQILRDKAHLDGAWITHQYALGERDETGEIHVTRGSFWNSMLAPSAYGASQFGEDLEVTGTERVELRRLDTLFDECIGGIADPRVFLKVDTQGYDARVLRGAESVLPRIPALQTEISFQQEYEDMTPAGEMIEYLDGLGYSLSGIFKVFRDRHLALSEADGVFVRRDAVG